MGEVWLARHVALGERRVAIKFLLNSLSPELLERFHREARIASKIRTRHVVEVVDFGEHQGAPFLVMEYLEGQELRTLLDERRRLDPPTAMEILVQAAKGLQKAHDAGLIHRDIKPENLFLTQNEDGRLLLKLLDFGIAKSVATEPQTATGAMIGTVYYMSPEQFQGVKGIDHRTDLWSLACVAYEMLVGERVFSGDSVLMLGMHILGKDRPVPSRRAPGIPPGFDAWFARALHPDLAQRFSSAQEMMSSLAGALGVREDSVNLFLASGSQRVGPETNDPVSTSSSRVSSKFGTPPGFPVVLGLAGLAGVVVVTAAVSFALRPEAEGTAVASSSATSPASPGSFAPIASSAPPVASTAPAGDEVLVRALALVEHGDEAKAHGLLAELPVGDPLRSDERFTRVENAFADRWLVEAPRQSQEAERVRMLTEVVESGADEGRRARARALVEATTRLPSKGSKPPPRGTKPASTPVPTETAAPPANTGSLPSRF
jgi:serine/threonine-protein kinase